MINKNQLIKNEFPLEPDMFLGFAKRGGLIEELHWFIGEEINEKNILCIWYYHMQ